jgi:hypothetical protein
VYFNVKNKKRHLIYIVCDMGFKQKIWVKSYSCFLVELQIDLQLYKDFPTYFVFIVYYVNHKIKLVIIQVTFIYSK